MTDFYESNNDIFSLLPVQVYRHDLDGNLIYSPLHWHRSIELTVTLTGNIRFNTGSSHFDMKESDWILVNSCELHSCSYLSLNDHFTGISFIISNPFIEKWLGKNLFFFNPGNKQVTKEIKKIAQVVYNLDPNDEDYPFLLMSNTYALLGILYKFCKSEGESSKAGMNSSDVTVRFTEYIENHYREDISYETMADHFKYNPTYFSRLFKESLGVNFHSYLNFVRASHAAEQLSSGKTNLTDCAFENGFPNVKSFITTFKKLYGCTPGAFMQSKHKSES
ncbi:helix-turn-helix domain-containing protein [Butyrivibrio sp. XB500-5]|uniref:helix-turn-helix domain-containing protein n=1 Tax=Butyrivibrio sp. XB500-5 TaxID=2364880 RepID=UPI0013144395|nr:AraC family transcriptional regulator [Butyrivibrio sp. XB500-5]